MFKKKLAITQEGMEEKESRGSTQGKVREGGKCVRGEGWEWPQWIYNSLRQGIVGVTR